MNNNTINTIEELVYATTIITVTLIIKNIVNGIIILKPAATWLRFAAGELGIALTATSCNLP